MLETVGRFANESPEHMGATVSKTGISLGLTIICKVVTVPHSPVFGVNVYTVVTVLFIAGDHVPEIPLFETNGKLFKVSPSQIGATGVKIEFTTGKTVTVRSSVVVSPQISAIVTV